MDCTNCEKRNSCTELCEAIKAELPREMIQGEMLLSPGELEGYPLPPKNGAPDINVEPLLALLDNQELEIIRLRFGFDGMELTQREIADELQYSERHIRRIEARALAKMREAGKLCG